VAACGLEHWPTVVGLGGRRRRRAAEEVDGGGCREGVDREWIGLPFAAGVRASMRCNNLLFAVRNNVAVRRKSLPCALARQRPFAVPDDLCRAQVHGNESLPCAIARQ
jgi:hypothetical protein